jgi:hypothetical protein
MLTEVGLLGVVVAGYTMTAKARSRSPSPPDDAAAGGAQQQLLQQPDRVQQQLDALGDCHIGYSHMQLPNSNISVVGARPFSKVRHFDTAIPVHSGSNSSIVLNGLQHKQKLLGSCFIKFAVDATAGGTCNVSVTQHAIIQS